MGLTGGNKNNFYFIDAPDKKFPLKNVNSFFREHKDMYKVMYDQIVPSLEKKLSMVDESELEVDAEIMDY